MVESVKCLIEAGLKLIDKKKSLGHGEWLPWLKSNEDDLGFKGDRMAQRLMGVAKKYDVNVVFTETKASQISKGVWGNDDQKASTSKKKPSRDSGDKEVGRPARMRSSAEKPLPVDIACDIVRPLVAAGQSADPKALAKKHPISHVTFEKAVAIERAVKKVHDEYRVDDVVRQHFAAKGRPEPTSSNPVAEVNAFHQELVRFTADVSARLTQWMESGPRLDADGKAALMQALYLCADECAELAQKLDGR